MNNQENNEYNLYRAVGAYIVEFEKILDIIRLYICSIIIQKETQSLDKILILLDKDTAGPLINKLKHLLMLQRKERELANNNQDFKLNSNVSFFKLIDEFIKLVEKASEVRNDIAHSNWIYGNSEQGDLKKLPSIRYKSKKGEAFKYYKSDPALIYSVSQSFREIRNKLNRLLNMPDEYILNDENLNSLRKYIADTQNLLNSIFYG